MKFKRISDILLLSQELINTDITVCGWVKTKRESKNIVFININDGSTIKNLQILSDIHNDNKNIIKNIHTGVSLSVSGKLVKSLGKEQNVELQAKEIKILGYADPKEYPLQPKKHSLEFLREIAHLRFRTNTLSAVFRIRSKMAFSIHKFFNEKNFYYINTPIITASDCEGAGQMFKVTTLDLANICKNDDNSINFKNDFFGKEAFLTVSGQLEAELAALGLSNVYTFGPTFRAENSNTTRHLAEFWMIEPEMAFYDLNDNMDLAEEFVKYVIKYIIDNCKDDLDFLNKRFVKENLSKPKEKREDKTLLERLEFILENNFVRLKYNDAFEILKKSKKKFEFPVNEWGIDLQAEHEKYLVEKFFKKPVIVYNYPKKIKAFYMRVNDDGKTVAAMDILFPGVGEIIGGSQREERYNVLLERINELGINKENLWWYLETRKFGTVIHSGFGLGFERFVQFCTGMHNIRDVIPFPRYPKNIEF